jgi:pseudouridine-5'-phosphate glycosidase
MKNNQLTVIAPEVERALATGQPVVALESTVIAHGLPRPINIETARRLEEIVRGEGVVPATIAVLRGKMHLGLTSAQLEFIGSNTGVRKLSIRDLPIAVAEGWDGATTVATTSWIANRAGIQVFATGGIGGVHRGELPDISADLPQLARSRMVVVCSGAKIVLDLDATREWLETHGITVIGYQCDSMPAFYSRGSDLPVDARVDTPVDVAAIAKARTELDLDGSILVTVPVPVEAEVPEDLLLSALTASLNEAREHGISGRDLTPFLLSKMAERSGGLTLEANIALLENNVRVGAQIAAAMCR